MGVKNIETIARKLIEHGKPGSTPAALIRWGTRPEQRTVVAPLGEIAGVVRDSRMRPPAVMVVGEVVSLREALKWYEDKPLFGHRVLITREYTREFEPLEELGAEIFEFPTLRIVPPKSFDDVDRAIAGISAYHWLVITSANAFECFMGRLLEKGGDIRDLKGIKICAIGSRTAEAVARYGMKVDMVPGEFSAEGLIEAFSTSRHGGLKGLKVLLPRAENARDVFPERVRSLGGTIDTPTVYRAVRPEKHAKRLQRFMSEGRITLATFTSGAAFNNFLAMLGDDGRALLKDVTLAVIGPVTKEAVEKAGLKVHITPSTATISAMVEEIVAWASRNG
jgi:uroporphyrinogen III methyltransferase/synthase